MTSPSPSSYRHQALVPFQFPTLDFSDKPKSCDENFSSGKENASRVNSSSRTSPSINGRRYATKGGSPLTLDFKKMSAFSKETTPPCSDSSGEESPLHSPTLRRANLFDRDSSDDMSFGEDDSPLSPTLKGKNLFGEDSTEVSSEDTSESDSPPLSPRFIGKNLFGDQCDMDDLPMSPVSLDFTPSSSGKRRSEEPELDSRTPKLTPDQRVHRLAAEFRGLSSPSKGALQESPKFRVPAPVNRTGQPSSHNSYSDVDFETPVSTQSAVVKTPKTPYKPKRKTRPSEFVAAVISTSNNLFNALSSKSGTRSVFCAGAKIGSGNYSNVYEIRSNTSLFESHQNDQLLVKCYHKDTIDSNCTSTIESFVEYSLRQYLQLQKMGFPVVNILNAATVKQDGFFVVERVPGEFEIPYNLDLNNLSHDHPLMQVKAMFQIAFDRDIDLDLSKNNVRINAEGKVILIDLMEEDQGTFKELLKKHLETFAETGPNTYDQRIYDFLMPVGANLKVSSGDR